MKTCWALVVVMLSGCATTSVHTTSGATLRREFLRFDADEPSSTRWHTIETDTFKLITDLPPAEAKHGAQLIAQSLAAVSMMFGNTPPITTSKIEIVAIASDMEFERVFGTRVGGVAFTNKNRTRIYIYGPPTKWFEGLNNSHIGMNSAVQHELAHAVLYRYFPRQPRWFAEGMAQYLETASWESDDTVRLGSVNLQANNAYQTNRSLSVKDMLAWQGFGERDRTTAGLYGLSWFFIHWAFNTHFDVFATYFQFLLKGEPDTAWTQSFAPMMDTIDNAIHQYGKIGNFETPVRRVPMRQPMQTKLAATTEADAVDLELFIKMGVKLQ